MPPWSPPFPSFQDLRKVEHTQSFFDRCCYISFVNFMSVKHRKLVIKTAVVTFI